CRVVRLLSVNRNVAQLAAVRFDELFAADKHSARAAAGVVDAAFVWCQHLDQDADDVRWRIELSAFLALGAGELRQEVLVHLTQNVLGTVCRTAEADVANEVDELTEPLLIEAGTPIILRQNSL